MKYVLAMIAGGVMVTTSFIAGTICMYGVMTEPRPQNRPYVSYAKRHSSNDEPKEVEE